MLKVSHLRRRSSSRLLSPVNQEIIFQYILQLDQEQMRLIMLLLQQLSSLLSQARVNFLSIENQKSFDLDLDQASQTIAIAAHGFIFCSTIKGPYFSLIEVSLYRSIHHNKVGNPSRTHIILPQCYRSLLKNYSPYFRAPQEPCSLLTHILIKQNHLTKNCICLAQSRLSLSAP